ncbi:hypothetical protein BBJ28_00009704 [Nothophytophthora sp. Chile5]|nr:hypothetical protein BBJ28_00009704 [Nothophytophthora sp. Chile5]
MAPAHDHAKASAADKRKIKKLTAEKLAQFYNEIAKRDGQQIDLTSRGIETIVSLEGLQQATKLDLSHNKLTKLSFLKAVPRVTMLKLTDNKLNGEGLAEIQHLKKLVILNAAENQVTRIPYEVMRNMRSLKALVLNNNSITTLDWMPKLPVCSSWLENARNGSCSLSCRSKCAVDSFACVPCNVQELNSLIVSHNRIAQIPQRILDWLPNLTKISIADLCVLLSLVTVENLKVLELSHNQIDDWAGLEALSSLENLRQLNMTGNPLVGQKLEVVKKSGDDDDSDDGSDSDDADEESAKTELSAEEKQKRKEAKRLDAKHKQYNFKMKRLFPNLVVRDAQRVLDKRVHGYVAPPKEDKKKKQKKPEAAAKKTKKSKSDASSKRKRSEDPKGDEAEKEAGHEVSEEAGDDTEEPTKKAKKAKKKHKSEKHAVEEPIEEVAAPAKAEKEKHHKKRAHPVEADTKDTTAASEKHEASEKKEKHHKKRGHPAEADTSETVASESTPKLEEPAELPQDTKSSKEKKRKEKQKQEKQKDKIKEKKKERRQPKEIASGVVAVKQFKKAKKAKDAQTKPVDLTKFDFTPNVGLGGSSAWD